jgi:hypothetical protein
MLLKKKLYIKSLDLLLLKPNIKFCTITKFDVDEKPAPGNPFHLAIPVHNLKLGQFDPYLLDFLKFKNFKI